MPFLLKKKGESRKADGPEDVQDRTTNNTAVILHRSVVLFSVYYSQYAGFSFRF